MAYYRLTEQTFIKGFLMEPGQTIEFAGEVSPNLIPITKAEYDAQHSGLVIYNGHIQQTSDPMRMPFYGSLTDVTANPADYAHFSQRG